MRRFFLPVGVTDGAFLIATGIGIGIGIWLATADPFK